MRHILKLIYLPPYSPNLNAIEELWHWLKSDVIYNRFHKNDTEIMNSIMSFFNNTTKNKSAVLTRLCHTKY